MWNQKKMIQMNSFIKQKQTQKIRLWLPKGKGGEREIRSLGLTDTLYIYKTDNQQGPAV